MIMQLLGEILKLTVLAGLSLAGILAILIWKKGLETKVTYLRFVIQALAMVAVFYLFTYPIWQLVVLIVILVMPLVLGRFFCGWLCPFGLYMDAITLFRKALKVRYRTLPHKLNKVLHDLRYLLLLFFLMAPFILCLVDIPATLNYATLMALLFAGPFRSLAVLLAPLNSLVVPWEGPLEIGGLYFSYPYIQEVKFYADLILNDAFVTIAMLIFLALTVVGSFLIRRVWCRFCPTGASLAVLNRFKGFEWAPSLHLEKNEEKCTKCGICKRVCPVQVTEVYEQKGGKINTSMCMLCTRCVEMCPYEDCLKLKIAGKTVFKSRNWLKSSTTE